MKVQFNIKDKWFGPLDPPEDIYGFSKEEGEILYAFVHLIKERGYLPKDGKIPYITLLEIIRARGMEGMKEILNEYPHVIGTIRDYQDRFPFGIYALLDAFVKHFQPAKIIETGVNGKSWCIHRQAESVFGVSENENLCKLLNDYTGHEGRISFGKLDDFDKNVTTATVDMVIGVNVWSGITKLESYLHSVERLLSPSGLIIFLGNEFSVTQEVKDVIAHLGLNLMAVIKFPEDVFTTNKNISTDIIIFTKSKIPKVFCGIFANEAGHNQELLNNLFTKSPSKIKNEQGILIHPKAFNTVERAINQKRLSDQASLVQLLPCQLKDLMRDDDEIESVWLSHFYKGPLDDLYMSPMKGTVISGIKDAVSEYSFDNILAIRLPLDEEKVYYPFFREYCKQPRHQLALSTCSKVESFFWNQYKISDLASLPVFLPSLPDQIRIVKAIGELQLMQQEIQELSPTLWDGSKSINEIQARLQAFKTGEDLNYWAESLPAPLAMILDHYLTEESVNRKIDHLNHFFEACSEYLVTIFITYLKHSAPDYESLKPDWANLSKSNPDWYKKTTFGTWTTLLHSLSSAVKKWHKDDLKWLSQLPIELTASIKSGAALQVLNHARELRNRKAHGGLAEGETANRRLSELESLFQDLRYELGASISNLNLLSVEQSTRKKLKFTIQGTVLKGTGPHKSTFLFTSNKDYFEGLYIRAKENEPPVPVAPLLLYEEVNLAFLFFSSFSKSISRYVNFDHGQIPELDIDDLVMTSQIEDIFKI